MRPADRAALSVWVVFERPRDFPRHIVVREQRVVPGYPEPLHAYVACLYDTLAEAMRDGQRCGLAWLPRDSGDDLCIVGCWV